MMKITEDNLVKNPEKMEIKLPHKRTLIIDLENVKYDLVTDTYIAEIKIWRGFIENQFANNYVKFT